MHYYCNKCKVDITFQEFQYSTEKFNLPLCRQCQPKPRQNHQKPRPTKKAELLYEALRSRNVPAKLELFDGYKHIDIAIPEARVNIEVDGAHHNQDYKQALSDLKRTLYSFRKGYLTLRIPNSLISEDRVEETAHFIVEFLNESNEQLDANDNDFLKWLKKLF